MYWQNKDERLRAYSCYGSFGYEYAVRSFDRAIAETTGGEQVYWLRVRAALDDLVA